MTILPDRLRSFTRKEHGFRMTAKTRCGEDGEGQARGRIEFVERRALVEGGAEFEDAGADGFYQGGERKSSGTVEKEDDAIEFAFTGTAGERKAQGVKKVPAANLESLFQVSDDILESIGIEWPRIEKEERELANDIARGVTSEDGVGIG